MSIIEDIYSDIVAAAGSALLITDVLIRVHDCDASQRAELGRSDMHSESLSALLCLYFSYLFALGSYSVVPPPMSIIEGCGRMMATRAAVIFLVA